MDPAACVWPRCGRVVGLQVGTSQERQISHCLHAEQTEVVARASEQLGGFTVRTRMLIPRLRHEQTVGLDMYVTMQRTQV